MGRLRRLPLTLFGLAVLGISAVPLQADALTPAIRVRSETEFQAAVSALAGPGGTIVLLPHAYGTLVVPSRSSRPLRIMGSPGVRVERILLDHTRRVTLGKLTVSPRTQDAWVQSVSSVDVVLEDVAVTARGTPYSASVRLPDSSHVTIRHSTFSHCGDLAPLFVNCLLLSRASHVLVEDSWFHDCLGCDFVHGRFVLDLTLRGNRFERALPCGIERVRCRHQDLVELFSGRWLRVEGNRFGVYRMGGAQLYLTNTIDHVRVVNNVFIGTDRRVPGYRSRVAMIIGSRGFLRVPHDVRVVNNTILTGAVRVDGYAGSIRMSSMYGAVPGRQRPILANNVIGLLEDPGHVCSELQKSVANVIRRGTGCSPSDLVGEAALDPLGRPTRSSVLLIDRASRRYAPARDIDGRLREGAPDVGAYEFAGPASTSRGTAAPGGRPGSSSPGGLRPGLRR